MSLGPSIFIHLGIGDTYIERNTDMIAGPSKGSVRNVKLGKRIRFYGVFIGVLMFIRVVTLLIYICD